MPPLALSVIEELWLYSSLSKAMARDLTASFYATAQGLGLKSSSKFGAEM